MRWLMPPMAWRSSLKRMVLRVRCPTTITLHLSPMRLRMSPIAPQICTWLPSARKAIVENPLRVTGTNIVQVTVCD